MRNSSPYLLVGIDAGGTKTECVALSMKDGGHCRFVSHGSNHQGIGIRNARGVWKELLERSVAHFDATIGDIAAAGFGISGLDRPKDEVVIRGVFGELLGSTLFELVNDTYLILRAGTPDGAGVAVVSGTGANAMGTAFDGKRFRVCGIGPEFGDLGSASDIGVEALRRASRSLDDRAPGTALVDLIKDRYRLDRLDDLADFFMADGESAGRFRAGLLAPLVFEAAGEGDAAAVDVLEWAGRELAVSARAVARNLFLPDDQFPLVMGGSVLQKGSTPHLLDTLIEEMRGEFPLVLPVVLDVKPVAGAVKYAMDIHVAQQETSDGTAISDVIENLFRASGPDRAGDLGNQQGGRR